MRIFQIGAFSDWLQTGFRLVSDWHEEFHIASSDFRLLQIPSDSFRFISDRQSFKKTFQISNLENLFQIVVWKIVKISDSVFTFQIASDSWELSVRECCQWDCLCRGGERCLRHINRGGGVSVMDRPGETYGGRSWQPGETDGGCGIGGQNLQEGDEGGSRWIRGQSRHRLLLFLGQGTYR